MQSAGSNGDDVSKRDSLLRIVVLGGGAEGIKAATRARRLNDGASITVLEAGSRLALASFDLPHYVAGQITDEAELFSTTPELIAQRYRIDARVLHDVQRIDRDRQRVEGVALEAGKSFSLPYDQLILAPAAATIVPPVPGMDAANVFTLQSLADAKRLRTFLDESVPVNALVLGADFSGLRWAEALSARGLHVTLLEQAAHALPELDPEMSGALSESLGRQGVRVLTDKTLRALQLAPNGHVEAVETEGGERIATDLVLLAPCVRPVSAETFVGRVFGFDIGKTGLGLPDARAAGYDADSVSVRAPLQLLFVYERASGKLLGAQAVGAKGVGKRIDVLATALHFGATLTDLAALDLADALPHSDG